MLHVTIIPADPEFGVRYPTYVTDDDGVSVGQAGELMLVAKRDSLLRDAVEFRIYAPGTWKEVNVKPVDDAE